MLLTVQGELNKSFSLKLFKMWTEMGQQSMRQNFKTLTIQLVLHSVFFQPRLEIVNRSILGQLPFNLTSRQICFFLFFLSLYYFLLFCLRIFHVPHVTFYVEFIIVLIPKFTYTYFSGVFFPHIFFIYLFSNKTLLNNFK